MTNCWSEGALRAYLDRELPAQDMKAVAQHLGECSACDALCAELSSRAARVFALLEELPAPSKVAVLKPATPASRIRRWWPAAAVAVAAGLAIASLLVPKAEKPRTIAQQVAPPAVMPQQPAIVPLQTAPITSPVRPVTARSTPRKRQAQPAMDFLALDDEPIESGVIMRVAVQPGNAQADIVFDGHGRARAIRLVSDKK